jgi:hypothetical protein
MRQITAALQAVQKVRSPRARVTVTVEERGQNPTVPALAWSELVSNVGQVTFRPVALVGLANGSVLKFQAMATECRMYTIASPAVAASWTGATYSVVVAAGLITIAALRVPGSSTIRLFYVGSANNVLYIESTNNGAAWGAPVTVYSGANAVLDLVVAYINNGVTTQGPWFVGFTTQTAGIYTPRFGYFSGAWVTHAYDPDWRAAGIDAYGTATAAHRCLVVRTRTKGASRLRVLDKAAGVFSNIRDLDQTQAGLFGLELSYYRFCQLPEAGCMLGVAGEGAYGAGLHIGVGGIFTSTSVLADEPIMFPSIAGVNSQPYTGLCSVGSDVYLAGDTVVYRGAAQAATATTLEVVRYEYDENQFELEFSALVAQLYVGQILVITRTLSWGAQSGSQIVRALIIRVEQGTDKVKVVAVDALGFLGTARCRRPSILNDGTAAGVALVVRKLAARFGIAVGNDRATLESAAVMPFTLAPSESLTGAAFRVGSQTEFYLVPDNGGIFQLTMITPGVSDSGDYNDTHHIYGAGATQQPVARSASVSDYRVLAFSYVLGTRSTDPADGGALAMAAGAVIDNTRPLSYSLTNSRYNTTARVRAAAAAEGGREIKLPITGIIEGQANLALELYDRVEVTEPLLGWAARVFRVRRIVEKYDRGRLTQVVYLGDS